MCQLNRVKKFYKRKPIALLNLGFAYANIGTFYYCLSFTYMEFTGLILVAVSLIGFWILKECRHYETFYLFVFTFQPILKIGLLLGNHQFWMFGLSVCVYFLSGLIILYSFSLSLCIQMFLHIFQMQHGRRLCRFDAGSIYKQVQFSRILDFERVPTSSNFPSIRRCISTSFKNKFISRESLLLDAWVQYLCTSIWRNNDSLLFLLLCVHKGFSTYL